MPTMKMKKENQHDSVNGLRNFPPLKISFLFYPFYFRRLRQLNPSGPNTFLDAVPFAAAAFPVLAVRRELGRDGHPTVMAKVTFQKLA